MVHPTDTDARRASPEVGPVALAERLAGQISRRASGRIRDLRVVCEPGHITVKGRTRTYHAKQLALQAVFDLIDGRSTFADQIVVA